MTNNNPYKYWIWTINNPTNDETVADLEERLTVEGVKYAIWQMEQGQEGTIHLQGYLELTQQQRRSYVARLLPRAHIEKRRGTQEQAIQYCSKEETRLEGPWSVGSCTVSSQGKRNDLIGLRDSVKKGITKREAIELYPNQMARYRHFYSDCQWAYFKTVHQPDKEVHLYIGSTGTGKTKKAREENPDAFWLPIDNGQLWFDGYDGQSTAILDDFVGRGSKVGLTQLLRILHDQTEKVPIKGGFVVWCPTKIIITTNIHPQEWYDYENRQEQYNALVRRITNVWRFDTTEGVRVSLQINKDTYL